MAAATCESLYVPGGKTPRNYSLQLTAFVRGRQDLRIRFPGSVFVTHPCAGGYPSSRFLCAGNNYSITGNQNAFIADLNDSVKIITLGRAALIWPEKQS